VIHCGWDVDVTVRRISALPGLQSDAISDVTLNL